MSHVSAFRFSRLLPYGLWFLLPFACACNAVRQTVLFQTESSINLPAFYEAYISASRNYQITNMDYIAISVFTNRGEVLIDPNNEFEGGSGAPANGDGGGGVGFNTGSTLPISANMQRPRNYLVNSRGMVNLPMVGEIKLSGYTLTQADSILTARYSEFYEEPYVMTQYLNKRVVLMGALGDRVMPMREENMTLIELLATASGGGGMGQQFMMGSSFQQFAKGNNIRIIRGRGEETSVQLVDLTTIDGVRRANLDLMPNDVVYVEPRRKLDRQAFSDLNTLISPLTTLVSAVSSVITLYLLIDRLGNP